MNKPLDLSGQSFGRLTVLNREGSLRSKSAWLCRCICGNEVIKTSDDLRSSNTLSCGCLRKEITANKRLTHGATNTPEFRTWTKMKERCGNENAVNYNDYGGRGIVVDQSWINSFETFQRDMGPIPGPGYSIERKDNSKGYTPGNCHWATKTEQNRNRRNTLTFRYLDRDVTLGELSDLTGLSYRLLYKRIVTLGWTVEEAIQS